ncbi:MAG: WD40/YVTN/BNR-like repeat-containing protein [Gemmatimonadales bacterium]
MKSVRWLSSAASGLLALALAGCLDQEPTAPDGTPLPDPVPTLLPSTLWLETGDTLTLRAEPSQPMSLRVSNGNVLGLSGPRMTALAPGTAEVEALFQVGRQTSTVEVRAPIASRQPMLASEGLSDASMLGVWAADGSTVFAVGAEGTVLVTRDAGTTWQKMETPTTATLTAVWGSSPSDVYAVGATGTAIHYDGQTWSTLSLGTEQALLDVWGLDADHVYIVGAQVAFALEAGSWHPMPGVETSELWAVWGTAPDQLFTSGQNGVIQTWDGTSWRAMESPTRLVLFGLWGTSPIDVYAVGIQGTVLHYDGTAWSPVPVPSRADFFGIAGRSRSDIVVVGNTGAVISFNGIAWTQAPQQATLENLRAAAFDPTGRLWTVAWAGTVMTRSTVGWQVVLSSPILTASAVGPDGQLYLAGGAGTLLRRTGAGFERVGPLLRRDLYGITPTASGDLLVVGDSGLALSKRGDEWQVEPTPTRVLLRSVWAHPTDPDAVFAAGDRGTIIQRVGGVWRVHQTPTTAFIRHIWGLNGRDVFAVGDSGVVLRYRGEGWERIPTPTALRLRAVVGTGPRDIVAVGEAGVAIRFDGQSWYQVPTPTDIELRAIAAVGPIEYYTTGHDGIMLRFNGSRWTVLPPVTNVFLIGLSVLPTGTLLSVGPNRTLVELAR